MKISEILTEDTNTITLYHGGRGLEYGGYREVVANAKGRWEHGPGLYLTTSYERAMSYAKGGRKVYKVVIKQGNDIRSAMIPYQAVENFVKQYVVGAKRKSIMEDIKRTMSRMKIDTVPATAFINLLINSDAMKSSYTPQLNDFLVDNNIDYAIVNSYGGADETVVALFNRDLIQSAIPVGKEKITDFDVKFSWE